jgi:hypothetical protein
MEAGEIYPNFCHRWWILCYRAAPTKRTRYRSVLRWSISATPIWSILNAPPSAVAKADTALFRWLARALEAESRWSRVARPHAAPEQTVNVENYAEDPGAALAGGRSGAVPAVRTLERNQAPSLALFGRRSGPAYPHAKPPRAPARRQLNRLAQAVACFQHPRSTSIEAKSQHATPSGD